MAQQIISTTDVKKCLGQIFEKENIHKVLLVCDGSFNYLQTRNEYMDLDIPYAVFNEFTSNPLYKDVVKGVKLFCEEECDAVIAVGGGSSIDVAKCIKLYSSMNDDRVYLEQEYVENEVRLIAIPTTSGTGSESTRYAVIYYEGKKQSVTHESIIPDYALLDYRNLMTLPLYQKKCTMMDAMCQSIESWWSVNATEESREYSRKALNMLLFNMDSYLKNAEAGNANMLVAANYAGKAINITQTTAAHAMSYKLTSLYGIPHGRAVFMCLPSIWKVMEENKILPDVFSDIAYTLGCSSVLDAIGWLECLNDSLLGNDKVVMDEADIDVLVRSVNPTRLKNNPLELTEDMIRGLYMDIIKKYQ